MNAHKSKARSAVRKAILKNNIKKYPCKICNNPLSVAHHYKGYEEKYWLEIEWLCTSHHIQAHKGSYKEQNTEGIITRYVPEMLRHTRKQEQIIKLIKKGRKLSDIAKLTNSTYVYVWKISKQINNVTSK